MHAAIRPLTLTMVAIYLLATLAVGYLFRGSAEASAQFLHARRTLPTAITAIAFLAANCGALEILGLVAASAKYGMLALHFYWIGAIPAMLFLALFMMPIYAESRALTVPEFLRLRYDEKTQILNMIALALMMGFVSGVSLYAISTVLGVFLGWTFPQTVLLTSAVVFCYVSAGGLKATIYNEVLQLAITILGLAPLAYSTLRQFHGLRGIAAKLPPGMTHVWSGVPLMAHATATMDVFGIVFGLGVVLSFGYWCTDFLLIQRALAARNVEGSIQTPLIAAAVKMFFPVLVVVPGLAAAALFRKGIPGGFDHALPALMLREYGPWLLGLGISAILASLMSGLAGNINALTTIWTHDLYRTYLRPHQPDAHYVLVGRLSTVGATVFSMATAYVAFRYSSLMDYLTLLFSFFNAPIFATFLLGMFTTWATPTAAFWGLICGMLAALAHNLAFDFQWIAYGSQMTANFYGAIIGFVTCIAVTIAVSGFTSPKPLAELGGVTYQTRRSATRPIARQTWVFAGILLAVCVLLNFLFR